MIYSMFSHQCSICWLCVIWMKYFKSVDHFRSDHFRLDAPSPGLVQPWTISSKLILSLQFTFVYFHTIHCVYRRGNVCVNTILWTHSTSESFAPFSHFIIFLICLYSSMHILLIWPSLNNRLLSLLSKHKATTPAVTMHTPGAFIKKPNKDRYGQLHGEIKITCLWYEQTTGKCHDSIDSHTLFKLCIFVGFWKLYQVVRGKSNSDIFMYFNVLSSLCLNRIPFLSKQKELKGDEDLSVV